MESIFDFLLRLPDTGAGDYPKITITGYQQIQATLTRTPLPFGSGVLANDTIDLFSNGEIKLHLSFIPLQVDEVIVTSSPAFPPECPGHGVNQS
jgi:hypothetical protein